MIHITYPLAAQKDYTELLYSLRSVEKHITPLYEIILIGSVLPDFVTNVTWIQLGDIPGKKQLSIRRKILAALEYADSVFMMNDDIYFTEDVDPATFPYYYSGTLKSYSESGSKSLMKQLEVLGLGINNYDVHYPIMYSQTFKKASSFFSEDVILKSMYCNYCNIPSKELPDNKIIKQRDILEFIKGKPAFSTGTYSLKSALPLLGKLFPNKSKFEL